MGEYTISVVIPTYNRGSCVGRAIQSVLSQTYPVHEVIVVDDGSQDDTGTIVGSFVDAALQSGTSVRYLRQAQQGVSVARNTGIAATTGNWIAFLDSDDCWLLDKLEWQVRAVETVGAHCGFCFTDALHVNNPQWNWTVFQAVGQSFDHVFGTIPNAPEYVVHGNHGIYIQSVLLRRDILDKVGGFDPALRIIEDNDFVFRCSLRTDFAFVNKPLVEVNRSPDRGEGLMELFAKEDFRLGQLEHEHQKWLNEEMEMSPQVRKLVEWRLSQIHAGWASLLLMQGKNRSARLAMQQSLTYGVTVKGVIKWTLVSCLPETTKRIVQRRYRSSLKAMLPGMRI
ncbi:MAG: glycosyltransferase family 2 protein [Acidobacteriota bacterium]|nr:glycosyltransferase family 2 protein [Acidobacteriota bacterium]